MGAGFRCAFVCTLLSSNPAVPLLDQGLTKGKHPKLGRWSLVLPREGLFVNSTNFSSSVIEKLRDSVGRRDLLVLGISIQSHDATFAVTLGGRVIAVVELERLHKIRYLDLQVTGGLWGVSANWLHEQLSELAVHKYVMPALMHLCERVTPYSTKEMSGDGPCGLKYDVVAIADNLNAFGRPLRYVIDAREWVSVDHHLAHIALGWFDSPFYNRPTGANKISFMLSYDGSGNDGNFRTFIAEEGSATITPVVDDRRKRVSLGRLYDAMASATRDLAWGSPYGVKPPCPYWEKPSCIVALAGSFMAYAAVGRPRDEWREGARYLLMHGYWMHSLWPSPYGGVCGLLAVKDKNLLPWVRSGPFARRHSKLRGSEGKLNYYMRMFLCDSVTTVNVSRKLDRDFAATIQAAFEAVVVEEVQTRVSLSGKLPASLVVSGGCGLNVKVNSALARQFGVPVHVPPAPADNGLAVGAAWVVSPPPKSGDVNAGIHFSGVPLTLSGEVLTASKAQEAALRWGARKMESVDQLARILLEGHVVGVARGFSEFGPRALGHRSLLAAAHNADMKLRLNRLKNRRWYRPCCPIVAAEDMEHVFEPGPDLAFGSPYMSFAPPLQPWVIEWLPAIAHLDGTARPNGVREKDDQWMHSVLVAVRRAMAVHFQQRGTSTKKSLPRPVGVLINTSLNPKGMPIVSDALDALQMFCERYGHELNYVVIQGSTASEYWLFERSTALSSGLCEKKSIKRSNPDGLPTI